MLNFVKTEMPKSVRRLLAASGLRMDDITLFVFHQASGIALGADRVVMLATGAGSVENVIWTPLP